MLKERLKAMRNAVEDDPNSDNIHLNFYDRSKLVSREASSLHTVFFSSVTVYSKLMAQSFFNVIENVYVVRSTIAVI